MSEINTEISNKKQRLGRGLGSLLGEQNLGRAEEKNTDVRPAQVAPAQTSESAGIGNEARIWQLGIEKIIPSQFQPRQTFDQESLNELAQSIKEHGVIQPILVRKTSSGAFELIAGERRWRAAQLAGLHSIPAMIRALSNRASLELGIIENLQREDLNPIEEAEAFQRLIEEFNLSQQEVSEKVGKDRATVANSLRLLQLPIEARSLVRAKEISIGVAKALMSIKTPKDIIELSQKAAKQKLTVRQIEKLAKEVTQPAVAVTSKASLTSDLKTRLANEVGQDLQKRMKTKLEVDYREGKGSLKVHFYSDDEFNDIVERLKTAW